MDAEPPANKSSRLEAESGGGGSDRSPSPDADSVADSLVEEDSVTEAVTGDADPGTALGGSKFRAIAVEAELEGSAGGLDGVSAKVWTGIAV